MPTYLGDIRLGDTIDFKFSTVDSTGAPATLSGSPAVAAYPGNSTTEITAGITLTVDFDSHTGLNNVRVVATGGNGYATATNYAIVITAGTSGGTSVVGYTVGHFSIEARSAVMPTTAARTLGVDASGRIDLGLWLGTAPASLTSAFYVKADVEQWIGSAPSALVGGNVLADLRAWRGIQPNSLVSGQVQASDSVASGTVTSATASTIVVPVSSGAANLWRGLRITIRGAPGTGQSRLITADDGAGNLTIAPNWITNPTSSSLFTIDEWSGVDVLTWLEGTVNALVNGNVPIASGIKKNTALNDFEFLMTDSTNHNPVTGKTVTVTRSIDNGAFAAGTLSAVTEIANGIYSVNFGAGDLNGNVITLQATASGCDTSFVTIVTDP